MSVFRGQRTQRWKCHACGDGGTAIDLWMTVHGGTVGEAIETLGRRTPLVPDGSPRRDAPRGPRGRPAGPARNRPTPPAPARPVDRPPDPDIEAYVAAAEAILWQAEGEPGLEWLRSRGLTDDVLRANRVGYDPGPYSFRRRRGLPRQPFPGVVYPALATDGTAVYFQKRYLDEAASGRKFANPWSGLASNPLVAVVRRSVEDDAFGDLVAVTEGFADGYVLAQAGARVAAVVGASNHGADVAARICELFPTGRLFIPWDADYSGRHGGSLLGLNLLDAKREVVVGAPPTTCNDVNGWWRSSPATLSAAVVAAQQPALYCSEPAVGVHEMSPGGSLDRVEVPTL
jgi:hypothetical protein